MELTVLLPPLFPLLVRAPSRAKILASRAPILSMGVRDDTLTPLPLPSSSPSSVYSSSYGGGGALRSCSAWKVEEEEVNFCGWSCCQPSFVVALVLL